MTPLLAPCSISLQEARGELSMQVKHVVLLWMDLSLSSDTANAPKQLATFYLEMAGRNRVCARTIFILKCIHTYICTYVYPFLLNSTLTIGTGV